MEHGEIPSGLEVCHRCNNKPCVRPSHLYAATHRTNMIDAMRDGLIKNMQKGGQLWNAKLTEEAVREIRIAHSRGEAYRALSRRFGVGRMQIKRIVLKERWAHVE